MAQIKKKTSFKNSVIKRVIVEAPPLILRLVNRPMKDNMSESYAKLCMEYILATWLIQEQVDVTDYHASFFKDESRKALAKKLVMRPNDEDDPNALIPQKVTIVLESGESFSKEISAVLGSPQRPLSIRAQQEKFIRCCKAGRAQFPESQISQLIKVIADFEQVKDIRDFTQLLIANNENYL